MNGFSTYAAPSLNGLKRSDGTSSVSILNNLTGTVNLSTNDPASFYYTTSGTDDLVLYTPFTTIQEEGIDTLSTNLNFHANKISSTQPIDAPLNIVAGDHVDITRDDETNAYTISAIIPPNQGNGSKFGSWSFEEHPEGYLNLMKGDRILFRFLSDPINVMTRVSLFKMLQNGNWHIQKTN